jgi:rhodanese-related sulfurtransferase
MKKSILLSTFFLIAAILQSCNSNSQVNKNLSNIDQVKFQTLVQDPNVVVLDVRTPSEVSQGYIPNATKFIDYTSSTFEGEITKLDKTKKYIVYCKSGGRSAGASEYMASKGFVVYNLLGGISSWTGKIKH